jgi:peptidoglycan hydrolase-like protein with peptidoglycan-binding domain
VVHVDDVAIREYDMSVRAVAIWAALRGYAHAAGAPNNGGSASVATINPGDPFPLPTGHVYGSQSGNPAGDPEWQHGGFYEAERPIIRALQRFVGVPEDGVIGPQTTARFREFEASRGRPQDGMIDALDWAAMWPAPAPTPPPVVTPPAPEPQPEPQPEPTPGVPGTDPTDGVPDAVVEVDADALAAALAPALVAALVPAVVTALAPALEELRRARALDLDAVAGAATEAAVRMLSRATVTAQVIVPGV